MITNTKQFFKENSYLVIKNFLPKDVSNILYSYTLKKVNKLAAKLEHPTDYKFHNDDWDGFRKCKVGDDNKESYYWNFYGDELTDTILEGSVNYVKDYTGIEIIPTYSFLRLYQYEDDLFKHIDRPSCEISATICLGYNISNVDQNVYPNYIWPICINKNGETLPIKLEIGDMLIYRGCDLEHWRPKFKGLNQAQTFLHFQEKTDNNNSSLYDGRKNLGLPKKIK
jgi:mRNA-degrading endonuclease YafQ of YafQ-DinJ toxin-antitoxin module